MTATIEHLPSVGSKVFVEIEGASRADVHDAAIRWKNDHWAYHATVSEPQQDGDVWRATGERWSRL